MILPAILALPGLANNALGWAGKGLNAVARHWRAALAFLALAVVLVTLWRCWAWVNDTTAKLAAKDAAIAEQAETLAAKDADIAHLNSELQDAESDMQAALVTFAKLKAQFEADLAAVARARQSERSRANQYAKLAEELRRDFPETRPASPVLLNAVDRVRLKLRPRQPSPADRVADKNGGSIAADTAGAV